MMDVSQFDIPDTAFVHLSFPGKGDLYADKIDADGKVVADKNGEPAPDMSKPMGIDVFGPASDQSIAFNRKVQKETQGIAAKKGMKGLFKRSPEEVEQREVDRLVAHTASVHHIYYKGEKITRDNIWKVYSDPKMGWLTDQVREKLEDWENFLEE